MAGLWEIGYGIKGEILRKTTSRSQLEGSECKFHLRLWLGSHLCHSDGPYMSLGDPSYTPAPSPPCGFCLHSPPWGRSSPVAPHVQGSNRECVPDKWHNSGPPAGLSTAHNKKETPLQEDRPGADGHGMSLVTSVEGSKQHIAKASPDGTANSSQGDRLEYIALK